MEEANYIITAIKTVLAVYAFVTAQLLFVAQTDMYNRRSHRLEQTAVHTWLALAPWSAVIAAMLIIHFGNDNRYEMEYFLAGTLSSFAIAAGCGLMVWGAIIHKLAVLGVEFAADSFSTLLKAFVP